MPVLRFHRLSPEARAPVKATAESAGWDIHSLEEAVVPARGRILIHTGLRLEFPEGSYGRIAPRSGLANNHGLNVGAGVLDRDYTGEVCVVLFNHSEVDFEVAEGMKIAQVIVTRYFDCTLEEVKLNEDGRPKRKQARMWCSGVVRGPLGFGSSGMM